MREQCYMAFQVIVMQFKGFEFLYFYFSNVKMTSLYEMIVLVCGKFLSIFALGFFVLVWFLNEQKVGKRMFFILFFENLETTDVVNISQCFFYFKIFPILYVYIDDFLKQC